MNPEIAETTGISAIGISFAIDFPASFVIKITDFDSFFEGWEERKGLAD